MTPRVRYFDKGRHYSGGWANEKDIYKNDK